MELMDCAKLRDLVQAEILVVVDDYETGEIVYEGPLERCHELSVECKSRFFPDGFDAGIEWVMRKGKPVALATVDFGERLNPFKEWVKAERELDEYYTAKYESEEGQRERNRVYKQYMDAHQKWLNVRPTFQP